MLCAKVPCSAILCVIRVCYLTFFNDVHDLCVCLCQADVFFHTWHRVRFSVCECKVLLSCCFTAFLTRTHMQWFALKYLTPSKSQWSVTWNNGQSSCIAAYFVVGGAFNRHD